MSFDLREKIEKLIGNKSDEFSNWAFNMDLDCIHNVFQFINAWNNRHRDLYQITYKTTLNIDLNRMIDLWKEKAKPTKKRLW